MLYAWGGWKPERPHPPAAAIPPRADRGGRATRIPRRDPSHEIPRRGWPWWGSGCATEFLQKPTGRPGRELRKPGEFLRRASPPGPPLESPEMPQEWNTPALHRPAAGSQAGLASSVHESDDGGVLDEEDEDADLDDVVQAVRA